MLRSLGGKPLSSDPALYCYYSSSQALELILSTHVDDKKGGGIPEVRKRVQEGLEKAFGALTVQETNFLSLIHI